MSWLHSWCQSVQKIFCRPPSPLRHLSATSPGTATTTRSCRTSRAWTWPTFATLVSVSSQVHCGRRLRSSTEIVSHIKIVVAGKIPDKRCFDWFFFKSSQKEDCFCHEGRCSRFHWECHQSQECNKLDKCNHGLCACIGNTCEFDCRDTADCINYPCSKHQGYHCKCDESQCIFEKDSSNVSEVVNQTKCREHKDCFGLEQEILLKDPLKLAANYMCHEGKCHGVPHFVHTNDVCSRKKDCKYFYKCFLQSLRQNSTNSCFCDSGLCQVNLKLQGEKVQQKQRKKSCRSHTETKKKNQTSDQKSNQEINHHKEKHHKENHSFKTKKTRKCVRKTKMKRSKRV